jgi:hypothetical protein
MSVGTAVGRVRATEVLAVAEPTYARTSPLGAAAARLWRDVIDSRGEPSRVGRVLIADGQWASGEPFASSVLGWGGAPVSSIMLLARRLVACGPRLRASASTWVLVAEGVTGWRWAWTSMTRSS